MATAIDRNDNDYQNLSNRFGVRVTEEYVPDLEDVTNEMSSSCDDVSDTFLVDVGRSSLCPAAKPEISPRVRNESEKEPVLSKPMVNQLVISEAGVLTKGTIKQELLRTQIDQGSPNTDGMVPVVKIVRRRMGSVLTVATTTIMAHKDQLKMAHTPIRTSRLQLPEATRRKRSRSESDEIVFQGCSDSDDEPFLGFPEQRNTNPTRTKRTKTSDNPTNDSMMSDSLIMTRSRARKIKK